MHTYYLGREEVSAYSADLAGRLHKLGDGFPTVWCPIGPSGEELLNIVSKQLPQERLNQTRIIPLIYNRDAKTAHLEDPNDEALVRGARVLVSDSAVHSGNAMLAAVRLVETYGAGSVTTYGLVLKRGAAIVPSYFGVIIDDVDRSYFLLNEIPNNRMVPFGVVRKLNHEDVLRLKKSLNSGLQSLDKRTWADLWYEFHVHSMQVYVYEVNGDIIGFVSFLFESGGLMFLDAIAVEETWQKKGIATALIRWAETRARSQACNGARLWAIENLVDVYRDRFHYRTTGPQLDLGDEKYHLMERELLYNFELEHND